MRSFQKYTAPELFEEQKKYGPEVDVYSTALILFEMFSGKLAFETMTPNQLIFAICLKKQRPEFDGNFPKLLEEQIVRGWSHEPDDRCKLDDFLQVLLKMKTSTVAPSPVLTNKTKDNTSSLSMTQQAKETQINALPSSLLIEMQWPSQDDKTKKLNNLMIDNMMKSSSFAKIIPETIIKATRRVPKHVFVNLDVAKKCHSLKDETSCLELIYNYSKPIRATEKQNMSSTEICCAQLSLIPLNAGMRVLFLGAKGGYIQSIAAQIVGFQGQVWICSQDKEGLEHVKEVMKNHVPTILQQIVRCVSTDQVQNGSDVQEKLGQQILVTENYFDIIHVCGSIPQVSLDTFQRLLKTDGQLLAPINVDEQSQKFTIVHKVRDPKTGETLMKKRIIEDWGVIFGPVT